MCPDAGAFTEDTNVLRRRVGISTGYLDHLRLYFVRSIYVASMYVCVATYDMCRHAHSGLLLARRYPRTLELVVGQRRVRLAGPLRKDCLLSPPYHAVLALAAEEPNLLHCRSTAVAGATSYLGWPAVQEAGLLGDENSSDKHITTFRSGPFCRLFGPLLLWSSISPHQQH